MNLGIYAAWLHTLWEQDLSRETLCAKVLNTDLKLQFNELQSRMSHKIAAHAYTNTHTGKKDRRRKGRAVTETNAKSHIELISINARKPRTAPPTRQLKSVIIQQPRGETREVVKNADAVDTEIQADAQYLRAARQRWQKITLD